MDTNTLSRSSGDAIYLKDIILEIWNHKIAHGVSILIFMALIVLALFVVPKRYTATILISAASDTSSSASGALGSLTSGLSVLAGLSSGTDPKKLESVAILQSGALTERYIQKNNLLPVLFADQWDSTRLQWKTTTPGGQPTLWKANEFFRKYVRNVTTDSKTGLVTLTITWSDPSVAATWANGLVALANEYERDSAIATSEENIRYLTDQAAKTDVVGIKQVIYSLLQTEFDKTMLARGNREYAFKIIDPARTPEKASYPQKTVWLLTALFLSLSISLFVAFCRVAWRKDM